MAFTSDHGIKRFPTRQRGNSTIAITTSRLAKLGIEGHEIAGLQRFGETFGPAMRRGRKTRAERENHVLRSADPAILAEVVEDIQRGHINPPPKKKPGEQTSPAK